MLEDGQCDQKNVACVDGTDKSGCGWRRYASQF